MMPGPTAHNLFTGRSVAAPEVNENRGRRFRGRNFAFGPAFGFDEPYVYEPSYGAYAYPYGDYGYAYNYSTPGGFCRTPQETCELYSAAPVGDGCSCGHGLYRGYVTP